MKTIIKVAVIVVILTPTTNHFAKGQHSGGRDAKQLQEKIEAVNNRIEKLYQTEDFNSLIKLYVSDLTFFPEYKPAIFETKRLKDFFEAWFKGGEIKAYKKKVYSVEVFSDHILEIGSFDLTYSSASSQPGEYNGNYMILWKSDNTGNLRIVSETFGADTYIEPEAVPYANVQVEKTNFTDTHQVSQKLIAEVEAFDAVVLKAVADGDGNTRAEGFTNDAILLGNFDSMRVGTANIRPKMLKTYKPDVSFVVKHSYNRIYDLGDYVFVNGQYKGGWGDSINGGRFEGNMSNLLWREQNGKLLMHRQGGNRDSRLLIFKN